MVKTLRKVPGDYSTPVEVERTDTVFYEIGKARLRIRDYNGKHEVQISGPYKTGIYGGYTYVVAGPFTERDAALKEQKRIKQLLEAGANVMIIGKNAARIKPLEDLVKRIRNIKQSSQQ